MNNILIKALNKRFNDANIKPVHLAGDASNRQFYKINDEVLCIDPSNDNERYATSLEQYGKLSIPCPKPLLLSQKGEYLFMSFEGEVYLNEHEKEPEVYLKCLQGLSPLWNSNYESKLPPMDTDFLLNEFSHLDIFFGNQDHWQQLKTDLSKKLQSCSFEVCHRDYHSRNILFKSKTDLNFSIIDTQDTRLGPKYYDIASYLVDPYRQLHINLAQLTFNEFDIDYESNEYFAVFIQRGIKAINTYVKMCSDLNKNFYFPFIKQAIINIETLYPNYFKPYQNVKKSLWDFQKPLSF